jgi:hypothetical protein
MRPSAGTRLLFCGVRSRLSSSDLAVRLLWLLQTITPGPRTGKHATTASVAGSVPQASRCRTRVWTPIANRQPVLESPARITRPCDGALRVAYLAPAETRLTAFLQIIPDTTYFPQRSFSYEVCFFDDFCAWRSVLYGFAEPIIFRQREYEDVSDDLRVLYRY